MFNLKNRLKAYQDYIINDEFEKANEIAYTIYCELIEYGFLPEDLVTMSKVADIFKYYSPYVKVELLVDLAEYIVDYATTDMYEEIDEEELGEITLDNLVIVEHSLDLEEGTKNTEILPYIFNSTEDIGSFTSFKLDIDGLENYMMRKRDLTIFSTVFSDRESLVESLLECGVEFAEYETIAENIPETCIGASLLITYDEKLDRTVKAVILAAYEMSEYPTM